MQLSHIQQKYPKSVIVVQSLNTAFSVHCSVLNPRGKYLSPFFFKLNKTANSTLRKEQQ